MFSDEARQFDSKSGKLIHLLTLEGVAASLYRDLFAQAGEYIDPSSGRIRKSAALCDRLLINAFFESSTRTRMAFEIAAKSMSAEVVNFDMAGSSATAKGESYADTISTIVALGADLLVIRHGEDGAVAQASALVPDGVALINGGDGCNAHPSQGLLDAWTITRRKGKVAGLRIAIVGDIVHSRVAHSLVHAFTTLDAKQVSLAGPPELLPESPLPAGVDLSEDVDKAVTAADVIVVLRMQYERMDDQEAKQSRSGYTANYCIDRRRVAMAAPDVMVMHPGPLNRGMELTSEVADGEHSSILQQVTNGVAMRMAIMQMLLA